MLATADCVACVCGACLPLQAARLPTTVLPLVNTPAVCLPACLCQLVNADGATAVLVQLLEGLRDNRRGQHKTHASRPILVSMYQAMRIPGAANKCRGGQDTTGTLIPAT